MNILVLNWQDRMNPSAGGAETHLHEIFSRVAAKGHAVTLYCSGFEGAPKEEMLDGMTVIREGARNTFNFFVPCRYKRDFRYRNFDIVIDDINKIPFYTPLYVRKPLLAIAHHLFGYSIFTEAGILAGTYVYGAEMLLPRIYKNVRFAAVSESTKAELVGKGLQVGNITVIPNCINQAQFPFSVMEKPADVPIITYFGRLKRYKSVHHLLEAFALVQDEFPQARLRIMGKGDAEAELRELSQTLGLKGNTVEFLGFVPEERKAALLSESACVVNPSMKEGWGIINIEANACGVPVIAADVPGLRDAVKHNHSGLLYEYGNVGALANALRHILADAPLRERLQEGAITFARQFDWDNSAEAMIREMERCISLLNSHS
ncbi:MAG: glycosyltransferase family 4 protein [Candidatus Kapabacteria bacterium]|jgi:glycosyltransferase involved in cell wall biosynthesis|nr:glycosyltransferase family 4 protein [Candidatus Kapabacteria bacterium]